MSPAPGGPGHDPDGHGRNGHGRNGHGRGGRPSGRRALFSPPAEEARPGRTSRPPGREPRPLRVGDGRLAVFSTDARRPGTVLVTCSRCGSRTPVPVLRLWRHVVPSAWVPTRRYPVWMHCPTCGAHGWCRLDWRRALPDLGRR